MQDTLMDHERRIAILEGIALEMRETLRSMDSRLNSLDNRFNSLDNRFNEVNSRITSMLVVTIILWVTTIGTLVGLFLGAM